jgi:hypothetical protein
MTAIKVAESPNPTRPLDTIAIVKSGENPKHIAPKDATRLKRMIVFFAPQESERIPTGTCIIA